MMRLVVLIPLALSAPIVAEADDGVEWTSRLLKAPPPGRELIEYRPGEPILVYWRVRNVGQEARGVPTPYAYFYECLRVRPAGGTWLQRDEQDVDDDPEHPAQPLLDHPRWTLKPGADIHGYYDVTLLYWVPEAGDLELLLPLSPPGRTQKIRIARPRDDGWRSGYLALEQGKHRIRQWVEPEAGAQADGKAALSLFDEAAKASGYLPEWALYYKAEYVAKWWRFVPGLSREDTKKLYRTFLQRYPKSQAAPVVRRYLGISQPAQDARVSPGAVPTGVAGDRHGQRSVGGGGATPVRSGPGGAAQGNSRRLLVLALVAAPVAAVAAVGVVIARRRQRA